MTFIKISCIIKNYQTQLFTFQENARLSYDKKLIRHNHYRTKNYMEEVYLYDKRLSYSFFFISLVTKGYQNIFLTFLWGTIFCITKCYLCQFLTLPRVTVFLYDKISQSQILRLSRVMVISVIKHYQSISYC